jgi:hypothetical protein
VPILNNPREWPLWLEIGGLAALQSARTCADSEHLTSPATDKLPRHQIL